MASFARWLLQVGARSPLGGWCPVVMGLRPFAVAPNASLLCADGGKSSPLSIKPGEEAQVAIKLEEKEGSEAGDSKEKVGLGRTSDHPGGEKYSPKVSFVLRRP